MSETGRDARDKCLMPHNPATAGAVSSPATCAIGVPDKAVNRGHQGPLTGTEKWALTLVCADGITAGNELLSNGSRV
jgi:hypothetical protein